VFLIIKTDCQQVSSALRLCDSSDCDITLVIVNKKAMLIIPNNLFNINKMLVFCTRARTITPGSQDQCNLNGQTGSFSCLQLSYDSTAKTITLKTFSTSNTLLDTNVTLNSVSTNSTVGQIQTQI
jgi:hypothetical protein